ncbi:MAG TPA: hypothetical protein VMR37_06865 [Rhabdochlamydiaceae bacterium]|nr:hypothetical protein [Rhabdochlamydiaceae bacterium]
MLNQRERGRVRSFSGEAALEKAKTYNKDNLKEALRCRYIAKQGTFSNLKDQLSNLQEIIDIELMLGNTQDALVVANEMTKVLLQNFQSLQTAGPKPYNPILFTLSKAWCYLGVKQNEAAFDLLMEAADLVKSLVILNPNHGFSNLELNQQTDLVDQIIDDLRKIRNQPGIENDLSLSLLELIYTLQFAVENYDGAQTSCSEMEDLDPDSTSYMRAVIRLVNEQIPDELVLGPNEDVIAILKSLIDRTPENPLAYPDVLFVARLLAKVGKERPNQRVLETALEYFEWAQKLNGNREFPVKILHAVLACQCLTEQFDDALQTAQKIIGNRKDDQIPQDDIAEACQLGKIARADETTLSHTDITADALLLGVAGRDHGDVGILDIALDLFELAKSLNEGKEFPHDVLIQLLSFQFANSRYNEALVTIQTIRACRPEDHEAILEQGIILAQLTQNEKAVQLFQAFLSHKEVVTPMLENLKFALKIILKLNLPQLASAYEAWIAEIEARPAH